MAATKTVLLRDGTPAVVCSKCWDNDSHAAEHAPNKHIRNIGWRVIYICTCPQEST